MGEDTPAGDAAAEAYREHVLRSAAVRAQRLAEANDRYAAGGDGQQDPGRHGRYLAERGEAEADHRRELRTAALSFAGAAGAAAPLPDLGPVPAGPPEFAPPQQAAGDPLDGAVLPAPRRGSPAAQEKAPKPRYWILWAVLGLFAAAVVYAAVMYQVNSSKPAPASYAGSSAGASTASARSGAAEVLYEVEGSAPGADLTMATATGTVQQNERAVPLVSSSTGKRGLTTTMGRGSFVYLSAQNTGSRGTITCRITVDGVVVSTNTSDGAYAIASCSGTAR